MIIGETDESLDVNQSMEMGNGQDRVKATGIIQLHTNNGTISSTKDNYQAWLLDCDIGPIQSQAPLLDRVTHESTFHILENLPPRTWECKAYVPKDSPPSIRETKKRATTDHSQ